MESLHYHIRQLDNAYLKRESAKMEAKVKHGKSARSGKASSRKGRGN
ncbi:Phage Tail Chaperonin [Xanthomonas phage Suba]|uniref:Phage Tail Chaperonin n=1 Tax=Xanthomonas phage Suba TaxID=2674975 RepID=A0A679KAJ9_9CAUD|nr:Phage Tail Chaperonin [Xanthomonas phage Suba]CAA2409760.1 Phage Tail Chaperonin [Xanthomonas phage Suba]